MDEDGGLSEGRVLVAVPDPNFQFGTTMSANNIRLRRMKGQDSDSCSLERKDALIPISFEIEGVDRSIR